MAKKRGVGAMPQIVNEQTADAVNLVNVKNVGELHALTAGLAGQNALSSQQQLNAMVNANLNLSMEQARQMAQNGAILAQAITGRVSRFMLDVSAEQAAAFDKQLSANLEGRIANIEAALSGGQQFSKTANTTPPQTGTGGAFGSDAGNALLQQLANIQALLGQLMAERTGT